MILSITGYHLHRQTKLFKVQLTIFNVEPVSGGKDGPGLPGTGSHSHDSLWTLCPKLLLPGQMSCRCDAMRHQEHLGRYWWRTKLPRPINPLPSVLESVEHENDLGHIHQHRYHLSNFNNLTGGERSNLCFSESISIIGE